MTSIMTARNHYDRTVKQCSKVLSNQDVVIWIDIYSWDPALSIPNPLLRWIFFFQYHKIVSLVREKTNEAATLINDIMIIKTVGSKLKSGENHLNHHMVKKDDQMQTAIEENHWNYRMVNEAKMHFTVWWMRPKYI